jgi:hypothetical protein
MDTRRRSRLGAGRLLLSGTRTWTPPSLSRDLSVAHEQRAESSVSHAMRRTTAIASASGKRTVAIEPGRCALRATACWQRGKPPRLHRSLILHRHLVECVCAFGTGPACVQTFAPKGTLSKGSIIQLHVVVVPRSRAVHVAAPELRRSWCCSRRRARRRVSPRPGAHAIVGVRQSEGYGVYMYKI